MLKSFLGVVALSALVGIVLASSPRTPSQGGKLNSSMEELGAAVKTLQEKVKNDEDLETALPDVWKAQRAVIDARGELPKQVAEMTDEKARKKAELAYRNQMIDLARAMLDVEAALVAGDAKKADKALRQADNLKSAGHSQFRPRDGR